MKIYLDSGHGDLGGDYGAVAPDGTREADITLEIAKITKNLLKNEGHEIFMSREDKTTSFPIYSENLGDLPFRTEDANKKKCDVFISIHCNASVDPNANGTEIYYFPGSSGGIKLASSIMNEVLYLKKVKLKKKKDKDLWNFFNRGIKGQNFYVLSHTDMPSVLIETLFLSNPEDLKLLKDKEFQQMYAMAITGGVNKYYLG